MNKVVVGIAIVAVLLLGAAAASWVFVVKPLWQAGSSFIDASGQWMELAALDEQVRNREDFDPPEGDRLAPTHVERFVAVQQAIERSLGADAASLHERIEALSRTMDGLDREPTVQEVFAAFGDLGGLLVTAKRAQVEALNAVNMSLEEYRYLRVHGFVAAGIEQGEFPLWTLDERSHAHNAELLRPHRDLLRRTLSAADLMY